MWKTIADEKPTFFSKMCETVEQLAEEGAGESVSMYELAGRFREHPAKLRDVFLSVYAYRAKDMEIQYDPNLHGNILLGMRRIPQRVSPSSLNGHSNHNSH